MWKEFFFFFFLKLLEIFPYAIKGQQVKVSSLGNPMGQLCEFLFSTQMSVTLQFILSFLTASFRTRLRKPWTSVLLQINLWCCRKAIPNPSPLEMVSPYLREKPPSFPLFSHGKCEKLEAFPCY